MLSKLIILVATVSLLIACGTSNHETQEQRLARYDKYLVQEQERADKTFYRVVKLFERDGCTVYGFEYHGHTHTFFKCEGKGTQNAGL